MYAQIEEIWMVHRQKDRLTDKQMNDIGKASTL